MPTSPCGRSAGSSTSPPSRSASASPPRGSGRLERLRPLRAAGLVTGCLPVSSLGSASTASFAGSSGAMFRRDANRGGGRACRVHPRANVRRQSRAIRDPPAVHDFRCLAARRVAGCLAVAVARASARRRQQGLRQGDIHQRRVGRAGLAPRVSAVRHLRVPVLSVSARRRRQRAHVRARER
eukprot:2095372-Pleurochrysis_carterae.AAC.1